MPRYTTTAEELTSIANAIRAKTGESSELVFPTGFVSAINSISSNGTDTSDANATASDILYNKTAYVNGSKITGNIQTKTDSDLTASGATVTAPAGYYPMAATKTIDSGTEGTPIATKGTVSNHQVSITPSVTNTSGYISGGIHSGTAVSVSASELVSGTKSITTNGTGIDVTNYASVDVNVEEDVPIFTATINTEWTTISNATCDKTYNECLTLFLDDVDHAYAMINYDSDTYKYTLTAVRSNTLLTYIFTNNQGIIDFGFEYNSDGTINSFINPIPIRDSNDLTISSATVTAPAGYYPSNASTSIASGSAATPATSITANPSITVGSDGLITATASATKSVTPTVSAGYVSSGIAGTITVSGSNTNQLSTKAAATIIPGTSNQTIASGTYLTGTQTISGDANLVASNIISGKTIFGVAGSVVIQHYYTGSETPSNSTGENGDIYLKTS